MSARFSARDLRHALILEGPVYTPDGAGGTTEFWMELGRLWAAIEARSGRERDSGELVVSSASYRIIVRAAPEGAPGRPRPRQRFRSGGRVFRIEAVQGHDPEGRFLRCQTVEEVTA